MQQQGALVGDERGVVGIDRVGVAARVGFGEQDLGPGVGKQRAEGLVLLSYATHVGLLPPAARAPAVLVLLAWSPDEHAAQLAGHRLAAELLRLDVHIEDRTSASRRSRKARSAGCAASSIARPFPPAAPSPRPSRRSRSARAECRCRYSSSPPMRSISSSPSCGPSAMATATARFSSTTGEGRKQTSRSYSAAICV